MNETPEASITALTLSDEERIKIGLYWSSPIEFLLWQKEVLANEIERRAGTKAQTEFASFVVAQVEEAKSDFPTLFNVPEAVVVIEPTEEPLNNI